jgi:hypothetical protein
MFKPITTISGRLENSSGEWIRTTDLRVMSPTSCHCSTPHRMLGYYTTSIPFVKVQLTPQ